jgi:hypothetical protein
MIVPFRELNMKSNTNRPAPCDNSVKMHNNYDGAYPDEFNLIMQVILRYEKETK